jgi:hypothetical protein
MKLYIVVAITAALAALGVEHFFIPSSASAQQPASPLQGLTVYANTYGLSSQKFDAFVFVNQQTGDIWVYRDEEPRYHYRVVAMGEPLQEVK